MSDQAVRNFILARRWQCIWYWRAELSKGLSLSISHNAFSADFKTITTLLQRADECNLILYFLSSNQSVWCWLQGLGALIQTITGAIFLDSYFDIELVWKVPYST
jgi:hypothetical protein